MCEIQKEQMISCQLSFITIGDIEYTKNIETVLEIIKNSGLYFNTGETSTLIKGSSDKVLSLVNKICSEMQTKYFLMNIALSNLCGCNR